MMSPTPGAPRASSQQRRAPRGCSRAAPSPRPRGSREILRAETTGGLLLIAAAVVALVWANSPGVRRVRRPARPRGRPGGAAPRPDASATWAADGLLAIFFFVAGLELKREFVAGDLRDPRRAALPVAAAVGGMVVPAVVYVAVDLGDGDGSLRGWAIPTATDIAFALAILAVISTHLPGGAADLPAHAGGRRRPAGDHRDRGLLHRRPRPGVPARSPHCPLAAFGAARPAAGALAVAAAAARGGRPGRWSTRPGCTPRWPASCWPSRCPCAAATADRGSRPRRAARAPGAPGLGRLRRAGLRVLRLRRRPSAGSTALRDALRDPVALGVVAGLVVGKTVGVAGSTWLLAHVHPRRARRRPVLDRRDRAVDAGRRRLHRLAADRRARVRAARRSTTTSWSAVLVGSIAGGGCWRRSCCAPATGSTAGSARLRSEDDDRDGIPDVYLTGEG